MREPHKVGGSIKGSGMKLLALEMTELIQVQPLGSQTLSPCELLYPLFASTSSPVWRSKHLLHRRVVKITLGNVYKGHGLVPRSWGNTWANPPWRTSCDSSHGAWPALCVNIVKTPIFIFLSGIKSVIKKYSPFLCCWVTKSCPCLPKPMGCIYIHLL